MTEALSNSAANRQRWIFDLAFAALCAVAFVKGIRTTGDLSWPYDLDQFREIGMAQSVLDGRYGTDHLYLGETIWYNPLTSLATATISCLSGASAPVVVTRAGAYLNLLGPISFYLLVLLLLGRPIALASGAAFLFAPIGDAPSWAAASYSPWLFSQNFAQGCFYLALAAFIKSLGSKSLSRHAVCGALLGLTFLAHTAPAVLLGVIVVVASVMASFRQRPSALRSLVWSNESRGLLAVVAVAFVLSLPFTFSILFHYHLKIQNPIPGNWVYAPLANKNFPVLLASYLSWFGLVGLAGFIWIALRASWPTRAVMMTWVGVCVLFVGIGELQQVISPGLHLLFAPAHHFLFYFQGIEAIFFGAGLVFLCRFVAHRFRQSISLAEPAIISLAVLCFVVLAWPAYARRFDFTTARDEAIGFQERRSYIDAYHWILAHTKPTDVFLSLTGDLDLSIVGPADRKTVVTCQAEFSNPYVDWKSRSAIAANIVEKVATGAPEAGALLARDKINYIITWPVSGADFEQFPFLSKQFAEENIVIYKIK